jgi:hypothetical protein
MNGQVVSSVIAVVGTLAGAVIGALSQREAKKIGVLERRLERYKDEIRARQAEEETAAKWLCSLLTPAKSELAVKRELRRRTELESGLRPFMGPKEMNPNR